MDQRSGDCRFIGRKNPRDQFENFQNFEMLDAKIASALSKIIPNSHFKKNVGSVPARKTCRLHDLRLLSRDYADLFSVTLHEDNAQEFDTRWYEILLCMSKIPSDDILESLYKLRTRESDQFKNCTRNVRHVSSFSFNL